VVGVLLAELRWVARVAKWRARTAEITTKVPGRELLAGPQIAAAIATPAASCLIFMTIPLSSEPTKLQTVLPLVMVLVHPWEEPVTHMAAPCDEDAAHCGNKPETS
jgi:hypothetical protein